MNARSNGIKRHFYLSKEPPTFGGTMSLRAICGDEIVNAESLMWVDLDEMEMPIVSSFYVCRKCAKTLPTVEPKERHYLALIVQGQIAKEVETHFNIFPAEQVARDRGEEQELKGDTTEELIHLVEKVVAGAEKEE